MNRRQFLAWSLAVTAGAAGYAYAVEPRWLRTERLTFPIPGLSPQLDGYTIGVLADLHLGPLVPMERAREAAERVAALKPDLVLVAGDTTAVWDMAEAHRLIGEALQPVKGAHAVLGNWDYLLGHPSAIAGTRKMLRLLVNSGTEVAPGLWLGGVDDGLFGRPDVGAAMAGAPEGATRILLAHEPDLADLVRPEHRIALQISGHSHGGQIRLPLLGPVLLPPLGRKYVAGLYKAPACHVYTSRGLGMTQVPFRFLCPPEITLITLRRP